MAHANARLTFHGRCLLVRRVRMQGTAVAHVAAELGVSRAVRTPVGAPVRRGGLGSLRERSSRPHRITGRTPAALEERVVAPESLT